MKFGFTFHESCAKKSVFHMRNSPSGGSLPALATCVMRPVRMSPTALPVLFGFQPRSCTNTRYISSLLLKFCCFCRREIVAPNFRPCAPAIFVTLSLNVSSSLCAYMSFADDHMLLTPPPQFAITPGMYGLTAPNGPGIEMPLPASVIFDGSL